MSIINNLNLEIIGRTLVMVGIILTIAKWPLDMEDIGYWTLLFLLPGVFLTFIGNRRRKSKSAR